LLLLLFLNINNLKPQTVSNTVGNYTSRKMLWQ